MGTKWLEVLKMNPGDHLVVRERPSSRLARAHKLHSISNFNAPAQIGRRRMESRLDNAALPLIILLPARILETV